MRASPKLRPSLWDAWVAAAVIALAVGCLMMLNRPAGNEGLTAVISVDGEEMERIVLQEGAGEHLCVRGNGYTLQILLEDRQVWVESSDCPTQDCVHTGRITRNGQSIVCLPARVSIQLEGGAYDGTQPDLVIG